MDDLRGEIDRIEKRTRRYWFDDGIVEISAGIVFLVVAAYFVVEEALGGAGSGRFLNVAFAGLVVVLAFSAKWAARAIKDRYVHPRTGFVAFPRRSGRRWAKAVLGFACGSLLATVAMRAPLLQNWIPAVMGGIFAVAFFYVGRRADVLRFPVEGLLTAAAGVAVSFLHVSEDVGIALLFGCFGLLVTGGGLVGLVGYLRHTRRPEEA